LWVVSHIHDDHIGGIIKYIKSVKDREIQDIAKNWYYNPPRKYFVSNAENGNDISTTKSIRQGDILFDFLLKNKKLLPHDITTDLSCQDLFGLKIHILSPTPFTLDKLREKYKSDLSFVRNESDTISKATSVCGFDYAQKIESFDINEFNEDDSLENESCISLLFEYKDKKVLWMADSHPSVIQDTLLKKDIQ
jgi:ribonuclease BN (tRNA processing enzyme)